MMISYNTMYHDGLAFEDYLSLNGYSYSGIKGEGAEFQVSKKMQLGTNVHNYLLTPECYNHQDSEIVKPLALALKEKIGPLLSYLKPEQVVTAMFESQNFVMQYKGRIDLCIPNKIVIDIKVSEMPIQSGINFFGYHNQVNGYAAAIGAKIILIISINPKTKKVTVTNIPVNTDWWEYQVIQRGEAILKN